jgi:RNA polymerase sigma-70 factor (ECF subfamily)
MDERWQLVAPHRERLLRLLQSRCTTHQDAEDCAHEAMLRVATFPQLDGDRAGQMLTAVAMRLAVDQHRQPLRRRAALRRLFASTVTKSPEDVALDRLDALRMLDHCEHLPAHERSVLLLRAQGLAAADVPDELGVSYKSAEGAYTRARRKLRAAAAMSAGFLGLGVYHLLRSTPTVQVVAAAAAAVVAVLTVPLVSAAHSGVAPRGDAPADAVVRSSSHSVAPRDTQSEISLLAPPAVRPAASSPATQSSALQPVRPATQNIAIDVHAAGVDAPPVWAQRHDDDKTFTQSLMQCVASGPSLTLSSLGCRP